MAVRIDMNGKTFGRVTVLGYAYTAENDLAMWECLCTCGNTKVISGKHLRRGSTKSCGCLKRNPLNRLLKGESAFNHTYSRYVTDAERRGYSFSLTKKDFKTLTKQTCFYCGAKPEQKTQSRDNYGPYIYNGLDRLDNDRGYELDNVVPCCGICNHMKNTTSIQEFTAHIHKIYGTVKVYV